jgi:phospholipid/cholesterol/gamma-HCH transport system substrate-binding protein
MESRAYALITGLFVLGVAACIAVWAQWLSKAPVARNAYRVVATVPITGLNPEAEVRYRGMRVGRVTAIGLDAKDPRRILVDIEADAEIPITKGTYARLGMEGITGLAYVHLLDDYKDMALAGKAASGYVEVPLRPAFFDILADGAEGALADAREVMARLNELMTPENRKRFSASLASLEKITANLEVASARVAPALARVEAFLSEENRQLTTSSLRGINETANELPQLTRETRELVKDARDMTGKVSRLSDEAASAAVALRDETLPRINSLAESVERDSQRFGRLSLQLNREPQSVIFGRKPGRPGPGEPGFQ